MKHSITQSVLNNSVGVATSTDGVMGLFVKAVAVGSTFALDTAYLLTSMDDLTALGINAAYDATNGVAVYQQVSEFYAQAGAGAYLWLVGVAKATAYATYAAGSVFANLIRFTAMADIAMRVKMIGLCYPVPTALQSANDFPTDVLATVTALQTVQQQLFNSGYQFSAIVDGYNMSSTVTPSTIGTQATNSAFSISLCVTGLKPNGVSGVGFALGRFSRITIGHGFGAVEDGSMNTTTAFLTNSVSITSAGVLVVGNVYIVYNGSVVYNGTTYTAGQTFTAVTGFTTFTTPDTGYVVLNYTPISGLYPVDIDALGSKQYLFLRTWMNHTGYYWNDGATCEDPTLQLSTQEYNRVANALSADALKFFIGQMGKNLPVDTKTGAVDQGYLNAKQTEFKTTYIDPLNTDSGHTGDLSGGSLTLLGPNFNSTKTISFTLKIVPTPILGSVTGIIEFTSTL